MANILAFPLPRRRDLIRRQAAWFVGQGHAAAEANLHRQLERQGEALRKRGVDPVQVAAEVRALSSAIRAEVRRLVMTPEVGA